MHRQYLHVDGRTIAYLDSAPGAIERRVAILVHAFPLSATMWEAQLKAAPAGWRLIAPDLRGFGGSTHDGEPSAPGLDDYAQDVIDLLRELDVQSAVVGGLSMGGYVVLALLRRLPSAVRAVVLADTRPDADSPEARANRRNMLALVDREGALGVAREMLPKLIGANTRHLRPDVEPTVRRLIKQQSAQAVRQAILRLMDRPDSTPLLTGLAVPALVIVGDEDAITPPDVARRLAGAIAGSELVVIRGAGHLSNMEQPEAFNQALNGFLSRLDG